MTSISDAEREVLKALWERGPGRVREIREFLEEQGRQWAHTTVITLLGRLESKGYVASDKSSFAHVFRPVVSREDVVQQQLAEVAEEYCGGEMAPLVLALVQGERFSRKEIKQFQELIDQLAAKRRKPKSRN